MLAVPVSLAAVMSMQPGLVIASQQGVLRILGRLLDGLAGEIDEHCLLAPTDALDPLGRNQDLLPRPPVPRIDDQITHRPGLVVDDEILDVTNLPIGRLDAMAAHIARAPQMGIPTVLVASGSPQCVRVRHAGGIGVQSGWITPWRGFSLLSSVADKVWIVTGSPHVWATPIHRPSVVPVIGLLELSRYRLVAVQRRTVLNLLLRQTRHDVLLFLVHGDQCIRGDQHLPAGQSVPGVGNQIANRPVLVVEVEFLDRPDVPVAATQSVAFRGLAMLSIIVILSFVESSRFFRCC